MICILQIVLLTTTRSEQSNGYRRHEEKEKEKSKRGKSLVKLRPEGSHVITEHTLTRNVRWFCDFVILPFETDPQKSVAILQGPLQDEVTLKSLYTLKLEGASRDLPVVRELRGCKNGGSEGTFEVTGLGGRFQQVNRRLKTRTAKKALKL